MENAEILEAFHAACAKFEQYEKLYEDEDFEPFPQDQQTPLEREYNATIDHADAIYSDVLQYGKMIARNPTQFGMTLSDLEQAVHKAGIIKDDIDSFEKGIGGRSSRKKTLLTTERVEPFLDITDLHHYLLS